MEGQLKFHVKEVSSLQSSFIKSAPRMIANVPWILKVQAGCSDRTKNEKYLGVFLECEWNNPSTLWSFDLSFDMVLVSQAKGVANFTRSTKQKLNYPAEDWGFSRFALFSYLIDPTKGYIKDDSITLEVNLKITNRVGMRKFPTIDFSAPQPNTSDVVLIVEGVRLHANKAFLGMHSSVFYSMFFSTFAEREQEEIELKEVDSEEFIELLGVLYPSQKPITVRNVEYLLKLGDKFDVLIVMEKCEKFLLKSEDFTIAKKLLFADLYYLSELQDRCLGDLKTSSQVRALKGTDEYEKYGTNTCKALLNKIGEFVNGN